MIRELLRISFQSFATKLLAEINPLTTNVPHHIETSRLICSANQLTDWFLYDGEHWSLMGFLLKHR